MKTALLSLVVVASVLVPEQTQTPQTSTVPVGALPWDLPQLAPIVIDFGITPVSFDEIEHSDDYDAAIAQLESNEDTANALDVEAGQTIDDWIGSSGVLPDVSEDFEPGIEVDGYEGYTAEDIAIAWGQSIGSLMARVRGLAQLDLQINALTISLAVIILCICWMMFIQVLWFGITVADMIMSLLVRVIELIPGE